MIEACFLQREAMITTGNTASARAFLWVLAVCVYEKKALLSSAEGNGTTHSWKGHYEQNLSWIVPFLLFVTWIS